MVRYLLNSQEVYVRLHLNLSIQSIPFGSSLLYTKQLKAALNSSPQGPCAIPPKQGQSQLISPVSSLKAPCWPASSSYSSGVRGGSDGLFVGTESGADGGDEGGGIEVVDTGTVAESLWEGERDSSVGNEDCSSSEFWAVESIIELGTRQ